MLSVCVLTVKCIKCSLCVYLHPPDEHIWFYFGDFKLHFAPSVISPDFPLVTSSSTVIFSYLPWPVTTNLYFLPADEAWRERGDKVLRQPVNSASTISRDFKNTETKSVTEAKTPNPSCKDIMKHKTMIIPAMKCSFCCCKLPLQYKLVENYIYSLKCI